MKEKYKMAHGQKNFKIQHVYLIFKYRTKIYTSIKVYRVTISHRNIKIQFLEQSPGETNPLFQTAINPQPPHPT